jgi:hypothetical protein
MHTITEWEANRSGAGITVHMSDGKAGGWKHKQFVKKIVSNGGAVVAYGGDGARFPLCAGRETSPEIASIAGELLNLDEATLDTLDSGTRDSTTAADLIAKIHKVAASALGQAHA